MKTAFRTWQSTADKRERNIMTVHKSVSELIGGTPLVELSNYEKNHNLEATIVGKVELFNPAGSVKDRIAKAMLDQAEAEGKLDADTVIIEPTSGTPASACARWPPPAATASSSPCRKPCRSSVATL